MPASHRLRLGRHSELGRAYLLTTTTLGRVGMFADFSLARLLVAEMRRLEEEGRVASMAWVIMPDHLHWLVQLQAGELECLVRRLKSRSARAINAALGRQGSLWQSGYHDRALRREDDLLTVARYIVANPLRAGLARRLGEYPHWDAMWL